MKESLAPTKDDKMKLPAEKAMEVPPRSYEVRKMELFIEIFDVLSGVNTGKFSEEESRDYVRHAMENGQIFEHKNGILARTCYKKLAYDPPSHRITCLPHQTAKTL